MNVTLGFGSTESSFEQAEASAIKAHVQQRYVELGLTFVTDEFATEIEAWAKSRGAELKAQSQAFDKAEKFPDRYSYYFARVAQSASDIVVILEIMHTNRRHALSPDGWAALKTTRLVHVCSLDL